MIPPITYATAWEVVVERERQINKWGHGVPPDLNPILTNREGGADPQRHAEELEIPTGPRAKFICKNAAANGQDNFGAILVEEVAEAIEAAAMANDDDLYKELIQVAAVAVKWAEAVFQRNNRG